MRISTSLLYQRGVNAIGDAQTELSFTQEQLATGERLRSPSDDPFASTRIVSLDEQLQTILQYQRNSDAARTRLELEESALTSAVNTLQRLRELAVQGATGSLDPQDRISISQEAFQHMEGLLQIANSVDANGEYIFSGDKTGTVAYVHDGAGTFTYQGDQGQRFVAIGPSREVAVGDSGYEVFENVPATAGNTNLLQIAYDFANALSLGTSNPDSLADIDASLTRVLDMRSVIGARVNAIESENGANEAFSLSIEANRSSLADLDYAEAVSRFQQQLAGLEAAQRSFVQVQDLSLFNFI
ncbi:MAG: flagellar hook-associated protein FlgL [Chromatiales bacterium]|jgi:flagellar hook-associated protein 3 FlgL